MVKILILRCHFRLLEVELKVDEVLIITLDVPGVLDFTVRVVGRNYVHLDTIKDFNLFLKLARFVNEPVVVELASATPRPLR